MSKRVIYFDFHGQRKSIINKLSDQYKWEPVYISGYVDDSLKQWTSNNYEECIVQDGMELRQAKFNYSKLSTPVPIDAEIISSISKYALNYLGIMDDTTGWEFSYDERKRFYYDMLKYWNTVIHRTQPDLLVTFTLPHNQTCYSLYLLCKYVFNIDVLFIDPVPLFDRHYHIIGTSLEKRYAPFIDIYESNDRIIPSKDIHTYLTEVRNNKYITPKYIIDVFEKDKMTRSNQLREFAKLIGSTLLHGTGFKKAPLDWKKNRKPYNSSDSKMNHFEYLFYQRRLRRKNIMLRRCYDPYCIRPDFNKKYIYFAASYQPEASTATNSGSYEDLFLVLDILSVSIPKEWVIYYKEHPSTFLESKRGSLRRSKRYFEKVRSYHNVYTIPYKMNTVELIEHAQAVATVAGSVGWEAVVRGKPALCFGSVWYQGCRSVFPINTLQDARIAIEKIRNGYTPDERDIERYAGSIEKIAVEGMIHRNFDQEIKKCENPEYEMERIAKALYMAYETNYTG